MTRQTICSFNNRLEFLSVHYGTKPERCTAFCCEVASTLENVSFYRFQIRLDDFRGYLLKSIAEQTADEATIEEVHSLPFISLTFGF